MDAHKISFQKLANIIATVWIAVLIIAFYGFSQKFSLGQLVKNVILKQQKLPLLVMAQGENKALPGAVGFDGGRSIAAGQDNFVFIGPYWPLLPGDYQVQWEIVPDCAGPIGQIDVVSRLEGSEYGKLEIVGEKAGEAQIINLDFTADFSWNFETRFYAKNSCGFKVVKAELVRERLDWGELWRQIKEKID